MPVAVITGASRGLGRALAHVLHVRGWDVITDGRDADVLQRAVGDTDILGIPGDVTDPEHRAQLVRAASASGGADLLVNNASTLGASPQPALQDLTEDTLRVVLETNVVAPHALSRDLLPQLRANHATIINISSDAAVEAYEGWGAYGSSKAGLDHLSRILAEEEPSLKVYAVDPGDMRTQMHQDAFPGEDISDRPLPETVAPRLLALVEGTLPSGRYRASDLCTPELQEPPS